MGRRLDLLKARLLEWRAKVNQKASIKSRVLEIRARRRLDENLENAKRLERGAGNETLLEKVLFPRRLAAELQRGKAATERELVQGFRQAAEAHVGRSRALRKKARKLRKKHEP